MSLKDRLDQKGSLSSFGKDNTETIKKLKLDSLEIINNQPFKEYKNSPKYVILKESIENNGITNPLIVREIPTENGAKYTILSGRHRYLVAKDLNFLDVPCIVKKNLSDDDAEMILLDSNLCQREELLPSEKAFSYKQKLAILNRQGKRTDLLNDENKGKQSDILLAEELGTYRKNIVQYVKLTELIPSLLDSVDTKKISLSSAYELAFLQPSEQEIVANILENNDVKITSTKSKTLKNLSQTATTELSKEDIEKVILGSSATKNISLKKLRSDYFSKYFSNNVSDSEMIETIQKALDMYFK